MVTLELTYRVQEALIAALNKRFDGEAYIGSVHNTKFIIDFYAYDKTIVTDKMIQDYITDFTATDEGDKYSLSIETVTDAKHKYQYVIRINQVED